MIQGSPKFDGLVVAKIEVDFTKNPIHIDVQAAFVNIGTGDTHGWTRGSPGWSEQTRQLIAQLRDSMEQDLGNFHFQGGSSNVPSAKKLSAGNPAATSGLAEHLGASNSTDGAPSV